MTLRWTQEDVDQYMRRGQPPPLSERAWMDAVVRVARASGFMAYHTYRSTKSAEGFPDLVLAPRPTLSQKERLLYAVEMKTDVGQVTPAQQAWLTALAGCTGVAAEIWRPSALDEIVKRLRGDEQR